MAYVGIPVLKLIAGPFTKAVGAAAHWVARRLWDARQADLLAEKIRLVPRLDGVAEMIEHLTAQQIAQLSDYIRSPEFESLVAQMLISRFYVREDLPILVRDDLRRGLDLRGIGPEHKLEISDALMTAIDTACEEVRQQARHTGIGLTQLPILTHMAAMATRKSEILRHFTSLDELERKSVTMRRQVAETYNRVRLPHVAFGHNLVWDDLYVTPRLVWDLSEGHEATPGELVLLGRRTVVLGDPGAGKSTFVMHLAYMVASDTADRRVPFVLVLRGLSAQFAKGISPLKDYLKQVANAPHNIAFTDHEIEYLLMYGRAVVVIDGLDELIDLSLRSTIIDLVESFARLYPLTPIVVTSRRIGYAAPSLPTPATVFGGPAATALSSLDFPILFVQQFGDGQVSEYAKKWFSLKHHDDDLSALCTKFLRESESVRDLRSNPLLLSLLCATYSGEQGIPRNRAQLYEHCAKLVFGRWDLLRGVGVPPEFHGRLLGAVRYLAWEMLSGGREMVLPRRKVLDLVSRFLVQRRLSPEEADEVAEGFLEFCVGRAWVLNEVGTTETQPIYGFTHQTFLDYYAADYLVANHETTEVIWQVLQQKVVHGEWEMVGQVALQLVERWVDNGADRMLNQALDSAQPVVASANNITRFTAVSLGHVVPSPDTVARVVSRSIGMCLAADAGRRRFGFTSGVLQQQRAADAALVTILEDCLISNHRYAAHAFREELTEHIAGSELAERNAALCLAAGMAYLIDRSLLEQAEHWSGLATELHSLVRSVPLVSSGEVVLPAYTPNLGSSQIELVHRHLGAEPFYRFMFLAQAVIPPAALMMHPAIDRYVPDETTADVLCAALMEGATPWLKRGRWDDEHSDESIRFVLDTLTNDTAAVKSSTARLLLLALPYLEIAALRGLEGPQGSHAALLIRARTRPVKMSITARIEIIDRLASLFDGMPLAYSVVLQAWVDKKLDVLG